jgi:hypothetical protein
LAHAAHTDERRRHAIVRASDVAGEKGSGQRHPRGFEELPAASVWIFHAEDSTTVQSTLIAAFSNNSRPPKIFFKILKKLLDKKA